MANRALSFFAGAAQGIQGARKEQKESERQKFLDELMKRRTEAEISQGERRLGYEGERVGLEGRRLTGEEDYRRGTLGLQREELGKRYADLLPGGFTVTVDGKSINLPGRADILERYAPYFTQRAQDAAAGARQSREFDFRTKNPEQFGGRSRTPLTPDEAKQQMLLDIFGPAVLGELPGGRAGMFEEALGMGRKHLPNLYGRDSTQVGGETDEFINDLRQFKDYDSAKAAVNTIIRNNPSRWSTFDQAKIDQYLNTLPRTRRPLINPHNPY